MLKSPFISYYGLRAGKDTRPQATEQTWISRWFRTLDPAMCGRMAGVPYLEPLATGPRRSGTRLAGDRRLLPRFVTMIPCDVPAMADEEVSVAVRFDQPTEGRFIRSNPRDSKLFPGFGIYVRLVKNTSKSPDRYFLVPRHDGCVGAVR